MILVKKCTYVITLLTFLQTVSPYQALANTNTLAGPNRADLLPKINTEASTPEAFNVDQRNDIIGAVNNNITLTPLPKSSNTSVQAVSALYSVVLADENIALDGDSAEPIKFPPGGSIDENGDIRDGSGKKIGHYDWPDPEEYDIPDLPPGGFIDEPGDIFDSNGKIVGHFDWEEGVQTNTPAPPNDPITIKPIGPTVGGQTPGVNTGVIIHALPKPIPIPQAPVKAPATIPQPTRTHDPLDSFAILLLKIKFAPFWLSYYLFTPEETASIIPAQPGAGIIVPSPSEEGIIIPSTPQSGGIIRKRRNGEILPDPPRADPSPF